MLNGAPRANYALRSSGFACLIFDLGSQGVAHHHALLLWGYYFGSSVCGRPPVLAFRGREHLRQPVAKPPLSQDNLPYSHG